MKYYTRTTHSFNNTTYKWEFNQKLLPWPSLIGIEMPTRSILGVHALDSGRWKNLQEIVHENKKYYDQYKDDPYSGVSIDGYSKENVLNDLKTMESLGWIKSKGKDNDNSISDS